MFFTRAIARTPGHDFAQGLTEATLGSPDLELTLSQHGAYCDALRSLGLAVTVLPPQPGLPDATFIEDTAIMIPGGAVITRLGTDARRPETATVEAALAALPAEAGVASVQRISSPGRVEGGDVMEIGGHYFIGISARTNEEGARQLGAFVEAAGGTWSTVPVVSQLHLKTSVNSLGENALLLTEPYAGRPEFDAFEKIVIPEKQLPAANCIRIGHSLLMASGYPDVRERIAPLGMNIMELDMSEYTKMDGGLSCLSLRF